MSKKKVVPIDQYRVIEVKDWFDSSLSSRERVSFTKAALECGIGLPPTSDHRVGSFYIADKWCVSAFGKSEIDALSAREKPFTFAVWHDGSVVARLHEKTGVNTAVGVKKVLLTDVRRIVGRDKRVIAFRMSREADAGLFTTMSTDRYILNHYLVIRREEKNTKDQLKSYLDRLVKATNFNTPAEIAEILAEYTAKCESLSEDSPQQKRS